MRVRVAQIGEADALVFGDAERVLRLAQLLLERAHVGDTQQVPALGFLYAYSIVFVYEHEHQTMRL